MSYCRFRVMADSTPTLKQRLAGRSLYLVGMMGSGKTSTGRPLAERLGYGFVDADAVIEQAAGCSIPDIFGRDGEAGFRSLESQVLSAISQRHSLVVATGGGVVTQPENWGMLHSGIVIWLDVVPDQLLQRLNALVVVGLFRPKTELPTSTTTTAVGACVKHIDAQIVADRLYNADGG